jgi:multiple sugar transport system substrate-binding protein
MIHNSKVLTADNMFGASQPIGANEAAQWMSLGYMWADGVRMLDDNFKLILDNAEMKPKVAGFLDMMKALYPTMPPGMIQAVFSTVLGQFSGRQVAHAPYAGRLMEVLEQRAPDLADQTGFFMYPDSAGKHKAVNHGYDGWVVLNTPRQDLSLKFMEWFTENRYIDFLHSAPLHFQPARMDIYDNPRWRNNPLIKKHADLVEFMKSILTRKDVIIRSVDTEGPRVDLRPAKMFQTYAIIEAIQDRLLKNMPADQAVEKAAAKYRKVL